VEDGDLEKMSLKFRLIGLLSCLALAILGHRFFYFHQPSAQPSQFKSLHAGDLIFRQGKGLWSPYFAGLNSVTGFSHVGVLIQDGNDWYVLHADADDLSQVGGVQKTPLQQFQSEALTVSVKANHMPELQKQAFVRQLQLMHGQQLKFDDNFELHDGGNKVYCTEYVWLAAQRAGLDDLGEVVKVMGRDVIMVDSIYQSRWLN
jgi:hypothetical protein